MLADGNLTLRGVIKSVTLVVKFGPHGDTASLDVAAQLKRVDFGIGTGQWADTSMIGNGVSVHGHLLLKAKPRIARLCASVGESVSVWPSSRRRSGPSGFADEFM